MGPAIDIDDERILLRRVEAGRQEETEIIVKGSVCALHSPETDLPRRSALQRIGSTVQLTHQAAVAAAQLAHPRHVESAVTVNEMGMCRIELHTVPAFGECQALGRVEAHLRQPAAACRTDADAEKMILDRGDFGGIVIYIAVSIGNEGHIGRAGGQAADTALQVTEIQALIAISVVDAVDEMAVVDEVQPLIRLDPGVVLLREQGPDEGPVGCIIHIEVHVMLGAVQHLDEDPGGRRIPADAGQVALVVKVRGLDPHDLLRGGIPHAQRDMLGSHPVHRILDRLQRTGPRLDVQQREVRHAGLILTVESQALSPVAPEQASVDAELVAADRSAIHDARSPLGNAKGIHIDAAIQGIGGAPPGAHKAFRPFRESGRTGGRRGCRLQAFLSAFKRYEMNSFPVVIAEGGIILPAETLRLGTDSAAEGRILDRDDPLPRCRGTDVQIRKILRRKRQGRKGAEPAENPAHHLTPPPQSGLMSLSQPS